MGISDFWVFSNTLSKGLLQNVLKDYVSKDFELGINRNLGLFPKGFCISIKTLLTNK